jgi:hypothetical protein
MRCTRTNPVRAVFVSSLFIRDKELTRVSDKSEQSFLSQLLVGVQVEFVEVAQIQSNRFECFVGNLCQTRQIKHLDLLA